MKKLIYEVLPYWIIGFYASTSLVGGFARMAWFGSMYLLAAFFLITTWRRLLPCLLKEPLAPVLIIFSGFSFLWSVTPDITFASFRSLIVQYILVGYLVTTYKFDKIIEYIAKTFSFLGLLCFFNLFFRGGSLASSWRGIFAHQSITAASMSIALISLFYFFLINEGWKKSKVFIFSTMTTGFICLLVLMLCGAKTSLAGFLVSFLVFPIFHLDKIKNIRIRTTGLVFFVYALGSIVALFYILRELIIVDVLGKSLTLTGRSTTWDFILEKLWEKPLQGYGLDAFWHNKQIAQEFAGLVNRHIPGIYNSHSGYYDLLIGLGILGFILVCLLILSVCKRTIHLVINHNDLRTRWCLQVLIWLLIAAYADAFIGLLKPRGIGWFIFSIISLETVLMIKRTPGLAGFTTSNPYLNKPISRTN